MNTHKPSIILGNGFNLALKSCSSIEIKFDYKEILEVVKARAMGRPEGLSKFLEQNDVEENLRTNDLEALLAILKNSHQCLAFCSNNYCTCNSDYEMKIKENIKLLKNLVIEVMTDGHFHPNYLNIFNEDNELLLDKCKHNLEIFDRIFTINYDLILYWFLNNRELLGSKFRDGFSSKDEYKPLDTQNFPIQHLYGHAGTNNMSNLFFLHGALHLLQNKAKAYKVVRRDARKWERPDASRSRKSHASIFLRLGKSIVTY